MSIILYYAPGACSFVPHVALEAIRAATGQEVEFKPVKLHKGEQRTPEYLAMNPDAQVPVLVVEGRPLTQIVAICDHLDRSYPAAGLLPTAAGARAQSMSILAWMNNTVHPTFTHVFRPENYTADAAAQASIRAHSAAQFRKHLERIQGWLECAHPWLLGERVSFADAYALTFLRWGGFAGIDPQTLPAYRDFVARLAQQPPVAAAIAREGIDLNTYKPAKT